MSEQELLTLNECMAARFLAADGYSHAELAQMLQTGTHAIRAHTGAECSHDAVPEPVEVTATAAELRARRAAADLTLREAAAEIGVSHSLLSNWETGQKAPRPEHVRAIDEAYPALREIGAARGGEPA